MTDQTAADDVTGRRLQDVLAAVQAGDLDQAVEHAAAALDEGLSHPLFFKLRAVRREGLGQLADAVRDFQSALALVPDDFGALSAMGLCLGRMGRLQEGLSALDASIAIQSGYAPAHCSRGWVLEALGDRAGARGAYERAVAIDPDNVQALGSLAAIAARSSAMPLARTYAARALALSPRDPVANIAMAMAAIENSEVQLAIGRMRALLGDPQLPDHERAVAFTVFGDALDKAGRHKPAFAAYDSANAILGRLHALRAGPGGPEPGSALAARLVQTFSAAAPSDWRRGPPPASPPPARGHVFVVGFPRSGTTFLGQVLAAHPDTVVLDEQETLADAARAFLTDPEGPSRLAALDSDALEPFRAAYWRRVAAVADVAGRVFVDKLPMNALGLCLIAKLFPDARVIVMRRDPRDVVFSCFRRQFTASGLSQELFTLDGAARFYDQVMRLTDVYLDKVELTHRIQRYEDLVADFEGQTREICAFLGLDWTPALFGFASAGQAVEVATPSAGQIARGLYSQGVNQWLPYAEQLKPVAPILSPWVERFGYAPG